MTTLPDNGIPSGTAIPAVQRERSAAAIASLVCGIACTVLCVGAPLLAPIGLLLGVISLKQTGPYGSRTGRGLAIAGLVLNSAGLMIAGLVLFYAMSQGYTYRANQDVRRAGEVDMDFRLIEDRLRTYWRANGDSFGPGGPVLAGEKGHLVRPKPGAPRVGGLLAIGHLVEQDDLRHPIGEFSLKPTGPKSAVIRHARSGRALIIRDIEKQVSEIDIGR